MERTQQTAGERREPAVTFTIDRARALRGMLDSALDSVVEICEKIGPLLTTGNGHGPEAARAFIDHCRDEVETSVRTWRGAEAIYRGWHQEAPFKDKVELVEVAQDDEISISGEHILDPMMVHDENFRAIEGVRTVLNTLAYSIEAVRDTLKQAGSRLAEIQAALPQRT